MDALASSTYVEFPLNEWATLSLNIFLNITRIELSHIVCIGFIVTLAFVKVHVVARSWDWSLQEMASLIGVKQSRTIFIFTKYYKTS